MWQKRRVVVGAGPRGPDSGWNSLEEPLKRKDHVRQSGPEGEQGWTRGGGPRPAWAGLWGGEKVSVFSSLLGRTLTLRSWPRPSPPLTSMTPAVQCEKAQEAFGYLASGREGRPFLQREGPPPCLPWPSRFEPLARGRPGKHRPDPRTGRGRSYRQMDRRLARSPWTRGSGLTAGDNILSGRLDTLSGRSRAPSES